MSELLTTKQLQDLLKIDRVTVYRMLNDGRLKGVKIGNQWRFPQSEIDWLMGETRQPTEPEPADEELTDFPTDCAQRVQEIFAGIIGVGAITASVSGDPLTEPTFSNPFCKLMLSSPSGRQACQASWRKISCAPPVSHLSCFATPGYVISAPPLTSTTGRSPGLSLGSFTSMLQIVRKKMNDWNN